MSRFIIALVFLPIGILVHGFVLMKMWAWFITSTFSIAELTIAQAIGIMWVVDFITLKIDWEDHANKVDIKEFASKYISHTIFVPFVLLGMSWIINLFM